MYYIMITKYGEDYSSSPLDNIYFDTKEEAVLYRKENKLTNGINIRFEIRKVDIRLFNDENNNFSNSLICDEFNVYLTSNYYYKIKIFNNNKSMWKYYGYETQDWNALHIPYDRIYDSDFKFKHFKNKRKKIKNCVGEIFFSKENLGSSTVSHEVSHATINFLLKFKDLDIHSIEEDFCYMLGDTVSSIYNVLYENKII